jgi:signal transduction histidine kinase
LSISKNKNVNLIDRSNREGLIENAEVKLLSEIIKSVALQELKSNINKSKDIEVKDQLNDIIESGAEQASNKLDSIRRSVTQLNDGATTQQKKLINLINEDLHFIANQVKNFESVASNLIEQREDIIELAGAGNMMHGVLHELARTTEQTKELIRKLSKKADSETASILEKLEREIKTINVRVRQFNPLAPSARNRKEKIDIGIAIKTVLAGYENRFGRHDINVNLLMNGFSDLEPFTVNMVPGFLYIAIENLIMNSVYWLKQDGIFSKMPGTEGRNIDIDIDTAARSVLVQDNGPGIAVSDKERVFDAGFSTKSSRKDGKGFGLFLAREIIRFHGGNLYLLPAPDSDNKLRTFVIELPDENK